MSRAWMSWTGGAGALMALTALSGCGDGPPVTDSYTVLAQAKHTLVIVRPERRDCPAVRHCEPFPPRQLVWAESDEPSLIEVVSVNSEGELVVQAHQPGEVLVTLRDALDEEIRIQVRAKTPRSVTLWHHTPESGPGRGGEGRYLAGSPAKLTMRFHSEAGGEGVPLYGWDHDYLRATDAQGREVPLTIEADGVFTVGAPGERLTIAPRALPGEPLTILPIDAGEIDRLEFPVIPTTLTLRSPRERALIRARLSTPEGPLFGAVHTLEATSMTPETCELVEADNVLTPPRGNASLAVFPTAPGRCQLRVALPQAHAGEGLERILDFNVSSP